MSMDVFSTLHFLPDLIPDDDGHYKSLLDVYMQNTSEEHRPSLQATMSFGFSHAKMWRLLFCRHKLNYQEVVELGRPLRPRASWTLEERV